MKISTLKLQAIPDSYKHHTTLIEMGKMWVSIDMLFKEICVNMIKILIISLFT
jgi:hypothetical protein